jgi:hypothetical protein
MRGLGNPSRASFRWIEFEGSGLGQTRDKASDLWGKSRNELFAIACPLGCYPEHQICCARGHSRLRGRYKPHPDHPISRARLEWGSDAIYDCVSYRAVSDVCSTEGSLFCEWKLR